MKLRFIAWGLLALLASATITATAATRIWIGNFNTNLAAAKNWAGNVAPATGDALVFPVTSTNQNPWNTLVSAFSSITFNTNYTVDGNALRTGRISMEGTAPGLISPPPVLINVPLILTNGGAMQVTTGRMTFSREVTIPPTGATLSVFRWPPESLNAPAPTHSMVFQGEIRGEGGIRKIDSGDVFFLTNNTYRGDTLIEGGTLHLRYNVPGTLGNDPGATPFGPLDNRVEVRSGASLVLSSRLKLDYPITIGGFGERERGAVRALSGARFLLKEINLNSAASIETSPHQTLGIGRIDSLVSPPPALTLQGPGEVTLVGANARSTVPLRLLIGTFTAFNTNLETALPAELTWPRVQRSLRVEPPSDFFNAVPIADLRIPPSLAENLPTEANVMDPQVPLTVASGGEAWFGPQQHGLGSPLTLSGGRMLLIPPVSQPGAVAATHTGMIEVIRNTRFSSATISGPLGIPGTLTVHSSSATAPELAFQAHPWTHNRGWLEGDTLMVDGVNLSLQGRQANRLNQLIVQRGRVNLSQIEGPGAALVNVVGDDTTSATRATLSWGASGQFPAGAELVIHKSGAFLWNGANPSPVHISRVRLNGGSMSPGAMTCDSLEFSPGSRLLFGLQVGGTNLVVTGDWRWQGEVTAILGEPSFGELGTPICLIDNRGPSPIPGTLGDLPHGAIRQLQGMPYRVNYFGGDGNDLMLERVAPNAPPPLQVSPTPDGSLVLRWPVAGPTCALEFRSTLMGDSPWSPITVPPPTGPEYEIQISAPGFYRLNCP